MDSLMNANGDKSACTANPFAIQIDSIFSGVNALGHSEMCNAVNSRAHTLQSSTTCNQIQWCVESVLMNKCANCTITHTC